MNNTSILNLCYSKEIGKPVNNEEEACEMNNVNSINVNDDSADVVAYASKPNQSANTNAAPLGE